MYSGLCDAVYFAQIGDQAIVYNV